MDVSSIKRVIDNINLGLSYKYYIVAAYVFVISCILFIIYLFLNYSLIYIILILLNVGILVGLYFLKSYIQATVSTYRTQINAQLAQILNLPENLIPEEIKRQRDEIRNILTRAEGIIDEIYGILNILMGVTVFFTLYCIVMIGMMFNDTSTPNVAIQRKNNAVQILQGGKRRYPSGVFL